MHDSLYNRIRQEAETLENQILQLQLLLKDANPARLLTQKNGKRSKWYVCKHPGDRIYLPKSEKEIAGELARSTYRRFLLQDCIDEKKALDHYLAHIPAMRRSDKYLVSPDIAKLMNQKYVDLSEELKEWAEADYPVYDKHPESLLIRGSSGRMLRSKSEGMIDYLLVQKGLPHRYEDALLLDGITYHPDFTIRHPITAAFYIWEHLGLIEDPDYLQDTLVKLRHYMMNGFYPSINLILTSETKEHPFDIETAAAVIDFYFS